MEWNSRHAETLFKILKTNLWLLWIRSHDIKKLDSIKQILNGSFSKKPLLNEQKEATKREEIPYEIGEHTLKALLNNFLYLHFLWMDLLRMPSPQPLS